MLNATLRNIKQDAMPKNIPGLSRNRSQVTGLQSGKQRISGRRFSPPGWWSRRSDDRKYVCVRRLARGPKQREAFIYLIFASVFLSSRNNSSSLFFFRFRKSSTSRILLTPARESEKGGYFVH